MICFNFELTNLNQKCLGWVWLAISKWDVAYLLLCSVSRRLWYLPGSFL